MLKALLALTIAAASQHVSAQATFTFAGLDWGTSVDTVDANLRRQGFSGFGMVDNLACKVHDECTCTFTGSSVNTGWAHFSRDGLRRVIVFPEDYKGAVEALRRKYGLPRPQGQTVFAILDDKFEWVSPSGQSIVAENGGIEYSGTPKRRVQDTSKF